MSTIAQMSVQSGVLRVLLVGKYSLAEAQLNFVTIIEAMAQRKVAKALIDGREVSGNPTFMERYSYGQFTARTVTDAICQNTLKGGARFAYVVKVPVFDPNTISELVALNRGMTFKVFDDISEAEHWLEMTFADIV